MGELSQSLDGERGGPKLGKSGHWRSQQLLASLWLGARQDWGLVTQLAEAYPSSQWWLRVLQAWLRA